MIGGGLVLVVETSTRRGSIALVEGREEILHAARLSPDLSHDRDLLPAIARLIGAQGKSPTDLTGVVLGRGPGSFTGLRVGAATVLGLHQALRVPVLGRPSIEATAAALLASEERAAIVLDARRGSFFVACYARAPHAALRETLAPRLCAAAELHVHIPHGCSVWSDCEPLLEALLPAERHPRCTGLVEGPLASDLWRAARTAWPPQSGGDIEAQILPLYLRASSPEEKHAQRLEQERRGKPSSAPEAP